MGVTWPPYPAAFSHLSVYLCCDSVSSVFGGHLVFSPAQPKVRGVRYLSPRSPLQISRSPIHSISLFCNFNPILILIDWVSLPLSNSRLISALCGAVSEAQGCCACLSTSVSCS